MARPPVTGLLETALYVADVARSRDFYQDLFGFEAMVSEERICALDVAPNQVLLLFRRGGTLKPVQTPGGVIPAHDGGGEQHFAFGIPADSLDEWEAYLIGKGIEIESRVDWPQGGTSLYFRDPDRLAVELATPGIWKNN